MTGVEFILLMIGIGILAGIISAAAGLASLVTYPSLLAMGLPPVTANVTSAFSTIASGYSSLFASTKELQGHQKQVKIVLPLVLVGSVTEPDPVLKGRRTVVVLRPFFCGDSVTKL